ncbi:MAG: PAS domain-containing sensor histidine kinase [Gemmatimonadetes bacterium GWC2_71_10]|nr:MAG: PAS domain-containing sensor histidine kinase [Gemmatimonadetes bacterium GWC2_71_10]
MNHGRRVLLVSLLGGFPALAILLLMLFTGDHTAKVRWTAVVLLGGWWLALGFLAQERVIRPLQTIGNMIAGLREGDFSIRARGATSDDDLGLALLELNTLGEVLRQQRLGAMEATTLLRRVMAEIDVAVFAFDEAGRLRLANRGGEKLLAAPVERLVGRGAAELGVAPCLAGDAAGVRDMAFGGGAGRFGYRRSSFRQGGRPHTLLVLADLSRALRDEERLAWQRLIRVLGHEINNSLAPIKSVAQSLRGRAAEPDIEQGLDLIAGRAEALARFMAAYARLARLPQPRLAPLDVNTWVRRVAALEMRMQVRVEPGPDVSISADGDQLDQVLINLIANAVDAVGQQSEGGQVEVGWTVADGHLTVRVVDEGPGIAGTANLFVPFFTTKPKGTGIGLALSRQIAEAHGGTITLANRMGHKGAEAVLSLPLS